jgi:hypothetical protein
VDKKKQTELKIWYFPVGGAIIGLLLTLAIFKGAYCFYTYQPGGKFTIASLTLFSALFGSVFKLLTDPKNGPFRSIKIDKYIYLVCGLVFAAALATGISPLFRQFDRNSCVGNFDELVALTDQESTAAIQKDMNIIHRIYTPDAIVTNQATRESWLAYKYYLVQFISTVHCTNNHGHYEVTNYTNTEITLTTSSQGTWGPSVQGCISTFNNPAGSDQWTFKKVGGEWKIVNFEFNRPIEHP